MEQEPHREDLADLRRELVGVSHAGTGRGQPLEYALIFRELPMAFVLLKRVNVIPEHLEHVQSDILGRQMANTMQGLTVLIPCRMECSLT